ncbi:MAG: TetR/AcrR family transcriptional regulator C-terminal ligand-binding domain-containing protein [Chloroflexia bacterium]|nr:TetR/AcrR family transcriptional regulator C-terminal ligand-binding domain-containing protein [Chloroflexia bacterium]
MFRALDEAPIKGSEGAPDSWIDVSPQSAQGLCGIAAAGEIRADLDLDLAIDLLNGPLWYRRLLRPDAMNKLDPDAFSDTVLRAIMNTRRRPNSSSPADVIE